MSSGPSSTPGSSAGTPRYSLTAHRGWLGTAALCKGKACAISGYTMKPSISFADAAVFLTLTCCACMHYTLAACLHPDAVRRACPQQTRKCSAPGLCFDEVGILQGRNLDEFLETLDSAVKPEIPMLLAWCKSCLVADAAHIFQEVGLEQPLAPQGILRIACASHWAISHLRHCLHRHSTARHCAAQGPGDCI